MSRRTSAATDAVAVRTPPVRQAAARTGDEGPARYGPCASVLKSKPALALEVRGGT